MDESDSAENSISANTNNSLEDHSFEKMANIIFNAHEDSLAKVIDNFQERSSQDLKTMLSEYNAKTQEQIHSIWAGQKERNKDKETNIDTLMSQNKNINMSVTNKDDSVKTSPPYNKVELELSRVIQDLELELSKEGCMSGQEDRVFCNSHKEISETLASESAKTDKALLDINTCTNSSYDKHFNSASDIGNESEECSYLDDETSLRASLSNSMKRSKLKPFTGKEDWKPWFTKFKSNVKGIPRDKKLKELHSMLKGDAEDYVFYNLACCVRADYKLLVKELKQQFHTLQHKTNKVSGYKKSFHCVRKHSSRKEKKQLLNFLYGVGDKKANEHAEYVTSLSHDCKSPHKEMSYAIPKRKYQFQADLPNKYKEVVDDMSVEQIKKSHSESQLTTVDLDKIITSQPDFNLDTEILRLKHLEPGRQGSAGHQYLKYPSWRSQRSTPKSVKQSR